MLQMTASLYKEKSAKKNDSKIVQGIGLLATGSLIQTPMKIQQNERINNFISKASFDHSCLQKQIFKGKDQSTSHFFNPL